MKSAKGRVITVTVYLLIYVILLNINASLNVDLYLFFLSPFLISWMVYGILKDTSIEYPELAAGEEWGYADKNKDELGVF